MYDLSGNWFRELHICTRPLAKGLQWCVRIWDVYPAFLIYTDLGSPDSKTTTKERSEKKCLHTFICNRKFHKLKIVLLLKC
jgi:hypothetical protein